ncbi:MAG: hypothetical protein ACLQUY_01345 [Ktedonobacterales bacterium]
MAEDTRFQEYEKIMEETGKLSDRRQTVSDLFLGVNSLFLTAAGFSAVASNLKSWWSTGICAAIAVVALMINITWIQLIHRYRALVDLRFRYLEGLEKSLQSDGAFGTISMASADRKKVDQYPRGVFGVEAIALYSKGPRVGIYRLERRLILIFIFAYILLTAIVAALTYLIINGVLPPLKLT